MSQVDPLPYKRRLKENERAKVREELKRIWDFNGDYWFPLREIRPDIQSIFVAKDQLTPSDLEFIKATIQEKSPERLYMITEEQLDYEIETSAVDIDCYETILCDKSFDIVLYGSHERTFTFGGSYLIDKVVERLRERRNLINSW